MCVCMCTLTCAHMRAHTHTHTRVCTHTQLLTEKAPEPDQVTAGMLELSDWEFKTATINMPEALVGEVDTIQGQLGDVSREMEFIRKH